MREKFGEGLLLAIDGLISAVGIIFSRDSLATKLRRAGKMNCYYFNRSLKRYTRSGLIESFEYKNKSYFRFTKKGAGRLIDLRLKKLAKLKNKKWDGWWRLIIFDIPEERKFAREALRRRLKYFGFFPLQKSVFVFPYECEKEIVTLVNYFEISDYVEIPLARYLGSKEKRILKFFNL